VQKKKRKYGDAWKEIEIDAASNDVVFDKFFKQPVAPPSPREPPSSDKPGSQDAPDPLRREPVRHTNPLATRTGSGRLLSPKEAHLRFSYEVLDRTLSLLDPLPRVVLLRLYRLAAGFNSNTCHVSIGKLVSHCKIKETKMRECLRTLEADGYIRRVSVDVSHKSNDARGITFEVSLPRISSSPKEAVPPRDTNPLVTRTPSPREPNKETHIKETHTNTVAASPGVRVASRFSLAECRKYAESLRSDGITNPGGYATKVHRSGEADDLIAAFLEPVESAKTIDASGCPDCLGSGFWEPGGAGKGVAKCKHERMIEGEG
jgi:DNA-binding Lrp family transcriptional regulator